jgi:septal ring factor EnvC (AmiA/AmiB activator)
MPILAALLSLVLVGTPLLAADPPPPESHDIYNLARTDLVNAQRQLADSSRQHQDTLERLERMQAELDKSLALLESAAQRDPSMKAPIDAIRKRLATLKEQSSLCTAGDSSPQVYKQLLDELQQLIEHY